MRLEMKKISLAFVMILLIVIFPGVGNSASNGKTGDNGVLSRSFAFQYVVHVPPFPATSKRISIWIPVPPSDTEQRIDGVHVASPVPCRLTQEKRYGNRFAYCAFDVGRARAPFDITLSFHVQRKEHKVTLPSADPPPSREVFPPEVARFLQPDQLVPTDGVIGELSRQQTKGTSDPLLKARKIYEYVIHTMHYDHDGTGWGRGDAVWACSSHHGNCTDFHSLFIGMARAAGIPARFDIGFPLPLNQHEGTISGYHCWAEFYIQGVGWIPIDASEAWQMPEKHDYFFGALDENRVRFSRGRDLVLSPSQAGGVVNYIVYPYGEVDGKPFTQFGHEFLFRDLKP